MSNILSKLFFEDPKEMSKTEASEKQSPKRNSETKTPVDFIKNNYPQPERAIYSPTSSVSPSSNIGEIDESIFEKLSKEIEKNNLPGNDYFEFKQALAGMSNLPLDEKTKIAATFAALTATGLTKKVLIDSLNTYIRIIENEKEHFNKELDQMGNGQVLKLDKDVENISNIIKSKRDQISVLENEIEQLKNQSQKLESESIELKSKVKKKALDFEYTSNVLLAQMKADMEKIENFLT